MLTIGQKFENRDAAQQFLKAVTHPETPAEWLIAYSHPFSVAYKQLMNVYQNAAIKDRQLTLLIAKQIENQEQEQKTQLEKELLEYILTLKDGELRFFLDNAEQEQSNIPENTHTPEELQRVKSELVALQKQIEQLDELEKGLQAESQQLEVELQVQHREFYHDILEQLDESMCERLGMPKAYIETNLMSENTHELLHTGINWVAQLKPTPGSSVAEKTEETLSQFREDTKLQVLEQILLANICKNISPNVNYSEFIVEHPEFMKKAGDIAHAYGPKIYKIMEDAQPKISLLQEMQVKRKNLGNFILRCEQALSGKPVYSPTSNPPV